MHHLHLLVSPEIIIERVMLKGRRLQYWTLLCLSFRLSQRQCQGTNTDCGYRNQIARIDLRARVLDVPYDRPIHEELSAE